VVRPPRSARVPDQRLHAKTRSAAGKIQGVLYDITDQLQWTMQLPWRDGMDERHRFDVLRLMRQVPAVLRSQRRRRSGPRGYRREERVRGLGPDVVNNEGVAGLQQLASDRRANVTDPDEPDFS
jgi:hypothetical protein